MNSLAPSASHSTAAPRSAISHPPSTIGGPAASAISHQSSVLGRLAAFTLIELLIVISIIAILAALALPAVGGAIKSARKAEVRSMANQIKAAVSTYYAEYGIYPTNTETFPANAEFLATITARSTNNNRRMVRFMEVPSKFSNASGIVTPLKFYKEGQSNFTVVVDHNFDGQIALPGTNINASVAVYVNDPDGTNVIGTWK
jgi:prepilin-type N-terminal cleavage/methylation domain-containing protein